MAIDIQEILRMDTSEGVRSLGQIREEIAKLREALLNLTEGSEDYETVAKAVYQRQQEISGVMNASKKYIDAEQGSMNQLLATLRRQKEEWKALGDVERADIERKKQLTVEINKTKAKINEMNESIGNHQHNVGNYTNSIIEAFQKMGTSFGGSTTKIMGMFTTIQGGTAATAAGFKSLWATMLANPIGIVIAALGALVGAVSAVTKAIHDNEESEMRMHQAMSAFRPIKDSFKRWLDEVGQSFVLFTEKVAETYNAIRETIAAFTDWMGLTEGREAKVHEEIQAYNDLAKAENNYIKASREVRKANAKQEARIAELRDEAMYTKDVAEKERMLKEARELQEKVNSRNIKIAEADLALKKANAMLTPNSTQVENELADAEIRVEEARRNGANALRALDRQLKGFGNTVGHTTKKTDEHAKALEREREAMLKAHEQAKKNAEQIQKESEEALMSAEEKEIKTYEERRKELEDFNLDTEALDEVHRKKMQEFAEKDAEARKKVAEETMAYEKDLEERRAKREGSGKFSDWEIEEIINRNDQEFEAEKALAEAKIALNEELMGVYAENDEKRVALERENAKLREDIANADFEREKKNEKAYEKLLDARLNAAKGMGSGISTILKGVSKAFGENTKASKGFAIAAATIDTIGAAVAGFKAGYNQWKDTGYMAFMAPIQAALNATAALAAGYAQVQQIRNVDTSGNNTGGGSAMALAIPNIEGLSSPVDYTRQVTTQTEQEEMNQNNRVYILESDIQQSNNRVKVREEETTF